MLAASAALLLRSAEPASTGSASADFAGSYGKLPLSFAPGIGRADFSASTAAGSIALTGGGALIAPNAKGADPVRMRLEGARAVAPAGAEKLPGVVNDFRGQDR